MVNNSGELKFCEARAKRTASPLTPALSPLRGEGARTQIHWNGQRRKTSDAFLQPNPNDGSRRMLAS